MRKVLVGTFVSADGVMQAPGGPEEDAASGFQFGGWVAPLWDQAADAAVGKLFDGPYDLLLGRKTYDIFASYWPTYEGEENAGIAKGFNAARKYVATSSRAPLSWANSIALHDPAADVARLKQEDGPNLIVQGSSVLLETLLTHRLIDRLTIITFPVILGAGKRLFGKDAHSALKFLSGHTSDSGVTVSTYEQAGPVKTGSMES